MSLQIKQVSKAFSDQVLFDQLNVTIEDHDKVALIGRNGSGKTTLLKMIEGEIEADRGQIIKIGKMTIASLHQMAFVDLTQTVREALMSVFEELDQLKEALDKVSHKLKDQSDPRLLQDYGALLDRFEFLGGYNFHYEMERLLTSFGFRLDQLDQVLSDFSGGERTRLAFVKMLLCKPDMLLLDEPTNHLDLETIQWLEGYLAAYPKSLIMTSHDRMFLDRVCTMVVELDQGQAQVYHGNYSHYLLEKEANRARQEKLYHTQQKEIDRLSRLIDRFRAKKNMAAMAKSKQRYLDRMDKVARPENDQKAFEAHFESLVRGGKRVLTLDHFQVGYDRPLLSLDLTLMRGQRMAVLGPNGCGKSTLLKTIVGDLNPLGGEMLLGHQIEIGYFEQNLLTFNTSKTVLEEVWDSYPLLDKTKVMTVLATFLFRGEGILKSVAMLSGGEKVRLALCKLMLQGANFLVLDEPTNHLDIESKEALEKALLAYDGTVLFVSHDRYFIDRVANGRITIDDQGRVEIVQEDVVLLDQQKNDQALKPLTQPISDGKRDYQLQNKIRSMKKQSEDLLLEIERAMEAADELRELRFEPDYYHDFRKMDELNQEIDEAVNEIAHLEAAWDDLEERIRQMEETD